MFEVHPAEILQARAVEMLAYIATDEARDATIRVIQDHPFAAVRAAAIDAHLYNQGDSAEEAERLRGMVRSEDVAFVGMPRFTAAVPREEFLDAVGEFYERHPERIAPRLRDERDEPTRAGHRGSERCAMTTRTSRSGSSTG